MKAITGRFLVFCASRLPEVLALFFALLFFLVVSNYFITEKGFFAKLLPTGIGFVAGLVGGGVLGWIVGGIGVVAMGTGIGIGAIGAVFVGAVAGAVLGGLSGASFSFVQMIRNPSDFDVQWLGILLVFFASSAVFFGVRYVLRRVPALVRYAWAETSKPVVGSYERQ